MLRFRIELDNGAATVYDNGTPIGTMTWHCRDQPTTQGLIRACTSLAWSLGYKIVDTENAEIDAQNIGQRLCVAEG